MKKERVLRAIGQINDALIADAQLEESRFEKKQKHVTGRKLFRYTAAACLTLALLTTAVLAATSWFFDGHRAKVGEPVEGYSPSDASGNSQKSSVYKLSFRLPLKEASPALIGKYYFPSVPQKYPQSFGYAYAGLERETLCDITFFWDVPNGAKSGIRFTQESRYALEKDGYLTGNELCITVHSTAEHVPQTQELSLGGVQGLLITEPEGINAARQYFYWSDGDYVFHMWFPHDMPQKEMAQMIASIEQVEDIRPQLISMSDEDLEQTFG